MVPDVAYSDAMGTGSAAGDAGNNGAASMACGRGPQIPPYPSGFGLHLRRDRPFSKGGIKYKRRFLTFVRNDKFKTGFPIKTFGNDNKEIAAVAQGLPPNDKECFVMLGIDFSGLSSV